MIKIDNYCVDDFLRQLESKKVICFCAGQGFLEWCEKYKLAPRLRYVVDNYKHGTTMLIDGINVPVVSMDEMGDEVRQSILLLTTMKFAKEMILQLDQIPVCDGLSFYIPSIFTGDVNHVVFDDAKPPVIPKTIHYCWFGGGGMPERFQKNIDAWKKCCPDYEIIRWDESNYDVTKNRYMRQAYEAKKWGFVPDYARMDIVNEYGGIYLDTDVELLKPLDSLLGYEMFCGFEDNSHIALGLGFGAHKKHCILEAMIEEYERLEFRKDDGSLNLVASPEYQTRILEKYGLKRDGHIQIQKEFIALSAEYFAPVNAYGFGAPTVNSFSVHQYAATWFDLEQRKIKEGFIENCKYVIERISEN